MLTPGHRSRISTMTARLEQRPVQEFLRRLRDLDDRLGQDLGRRLVVSRAVLIRVTSSPEGAGYPRSSSWSGTPARACTASPAWNTPAWPAMPTPPSHSRVPNTKLCTRHGSRILPSD